MLSTQSGPLNDIPAFTPTLVPPIYPNKAGLAIYVGPVDGQVAGTVLVNNVVVEVPTQFVSLSPSTTNYIYLDSTAPAIRVSTSGFPNNIYQIAICQNIRPNRCNVD